MKGDFTRRTFRPDNHYRSVLLQQGRVQLDADWNEQADIRDHLQRLAARDTFGPHGAPADAAGMQIVTANGVPTITAGRYYVDGVVCENDAPVPLFDQPDLPDVPQPADAGRYLAYLDVWTEHVTAVEAPELREVALGGPDTATRARTVWQVRLAPVEPGTSCPGLADWQPPGARTTGRMWARAFVAPGTDPDPCVVPVTAGYRRLENQLYRVEIRDGGTADSPPTFVWSRENGSVVARLRSLTTGGDPDTRSVITIDAPGRDDRLGFAANQWVELIDTARVRRGERGFLGRLDSVADTTLTVTRWFDGAPPDTVDASQPWVVRRWDSPGAVPVTTDWTDLEDGVQVRFDAPSPSVAYRTGDYWLIPARSADLSGSATGSDLAGNVEWRRDRNGDPLPQPPDGVEHRYAPIALLRRDATTWTVDSDCRRLFPPLTGLTVAAYAGGDGQETMPGEPLPRPLEVSVTGPLVPPAAATVRFEIDTAGGSGGGLGNNFENADSSTELKLDVPTGREGVAGVYWRPANEPVSQRVVAHVLDNAGEPVGAPIHFNATLSLARRVSFDPSTCPALAGADDVQAAIVTLAQARSLVAVSGDGQDGPPGQVLPQPVRVLVRSDNGPIDAAQVSFTVEYGAVGATRQDTESQDAGDSITVTTGATGVAECYWRLSDGEPSGPPAQLLTAELVPADDSVDTQPTTVAFTANSTVAERVAFHPAGAGPLAGSTNVASALWAANNVLNRLTTARCLVAVGGDGQDAPTSGILAQPVRVLVRTDSGPVANAEVVFSVVVGAVAASASEVETATDRSVPVTTGATGEAACYWRLDPQAGPPAQVLSAALTPAGGVVDEPPTSLAFTANRDVSPSARPALHVVAVELVSGDTAADTNTTPLVNDAVVESSQLRDGIRIVLDGPPAPAMIGGKPVLTVTLHLPYPLSTTDRALWGTATPVGTVPLTVAGAAAADQDNPSALVWRPTEASAAFVGDPLFRVLANAGIDQVLTYLTLTGRAVADGAGARRRVLNGLAYGRPGAGGLTELALPTADDVPGADFVLWFWLVLARTGLVVLPRRGELFRLKSVRDLVDLAVPRPELRAGLPSGVRVAENHDIDLTAARRAADRAFRGDTERRLRLIVDDRYAAVAAVIQDSLAQVEVAVDIVGAADPAETVRMRLADDERFDALLTDNTTAARIAELGGFTDAVAL